MPGYEASASSVTRAEKARPTARSSECLTVIRSWAIASALVAGSGLSVRSSDTSAASNASRPPGMPAHSARSTRAAFASMSSPVRYRVSVDRQPPW